MANVLAPEKQRTALQLLVEGNSLRSVERLTGVQKKTVSRLLVKFGDACRQFLDEEMQGLRLGHVQCDEIWTFVAKKQGKLTDREKLNPTIGDQYMWVAIDQDTKLVPTFAIGKRSADMARRFMQDLAKRLDMPNPHASDSHAYVAGSYKPVIQLSTDAFAGYPEAVDLAFSPYVKYGQIVKDYRNADQPGRYGPPEMVGSQRRGVWRISENELFTICTSHIERNNLTTRTFMKRFAWLSLGFSKKLDNLAAAAALHFANYNFCWRPRHTDQSGKAGQLRPTPAMMAGVTRRLWTFGMLFDEVRARYFKCPHYRTAGMRASTQSFV